MESKEPKEPKVYKTHDPDYFNKYYREHMAIKVPCPHCNKPITRSKMPRHVRMTKYCLLLRAQAELKQLKGEADEPEQVEAPEAPPLDVKWMVDARTARRQLAKEL